MIDLSFLREHPVAVLGLGKTGLPSALALYESGVPVWAWDDNPASVATARAHGLDIADLAATDLHGIETLLLSPGIPHSFPAPHAAVTHAKEAGLEIVSDIELLLRADREARVIGITGTNGKSTTTALIAHVLKACGARLEVGGNLGPAVLNFERVGKDGFYVLELSSYQLELTPSLAPDVGVLLNITPDHLARHGGMAGYVAAKRSLFRKGSKPQTAIIGIDDEPSAAIARELSVEKGFTVVTISVAGRDATLTVKDNTLTDTRDGTAIGLGQFPSLPGSHNAQNAAAAYAACRALGYGTDAIVAAIATFPGLDHRQKTVRTINGIAYINDSKATNADAAEKALGCYSDIYWIAGGQAKEGGLNGLEPLMGRIRHTYLIGEAAPSFGQWLEGKAPCTQCGTLDKAIAAAHEQAQQDHVEGAVVLLSPACASWDQFRSFEHRGDVFAELVRGLEPTP